MKYRCLVLDHDDTVVDSTASIHHPCFQEFLDLIRPGKKISLEEYFSKNFGQNFLDFCRSEYGFTDEEIEELRGYDAYEYSIGNGHTIANFLPDHLRPADVEKM